MGLCAKYTPNERLLRKRLAARLRQRRCRERKRQALEAQKSTQRGSGVGYCEGRVGRSPHEKSRDKPPGASKPGAPPKLSPYPGVQFRRVSYPGPGMIPTHVMVPPPHVPPTTYVPGMPYPPPPPLYRPPMPAKTPGSGISEPPRPVSVTRSRSSSEASMASKKKKKRKAETSVSKEGKKVKASSKELTAIDAMLSLRSNTSSDEETASTASVSTADDSSQSFATMSSPGSAEKEVSKEDSTTEKPDSPPPKSIPIQPKPAVASYPAAGVPRHHHPYPPYEGGRWPYYHHHHYHPHAYPHPPLPQWPGGAPAPPPSSNARVRA